MKILNFSILCFVFALDISYTEQSLVDISENNINYQYQDSSENQVSWFEAQQICSTGSEGFSVGYMVEFSSKSEWENVEDQLPNQDFWIGGVLNGDYGWWSSGRTFVDFLESSEWHSTKPYVSTLTSPLCIRSKKVGNKLRWDLQSCNGNAYVICQDKVQTPEFPIYIAQTNELLYLNPTPKNQQDAVDDCLANGGELAKLEPALVYGDLSSRLATYIASDSKFYFGLKSDGTNFLYSDGLAPTSLSWASGEPDLFKDCVVIDNSLASGSNWVSQSCDQSHGSICRTNGSIPFRSSTVFYRFFTLQMTFENAENHCQAYSGNLVTVDDPGIQAFIANTINYSGSPNRWWIGLSDRQSAGTYQWKSGLPVFYTPVSQTNNQKCSALDKQLDYTGVEIDCNDLAPFVCESDDFETTTAVATTLPPPMAPVSTTPGVTTTTAQVTTLEVTTLGPTTLHATSSQQTSQGIVAFTTQSIAPFTTLAGANTAPPTSQSMAQSTTQGMESSTNMAPHTSQSMAQLTTQGMESSTNTAPSTYQSMAQFATQGTESSSINMAPSMTGSMTPSTTVNTSPASHTATIESSTTDALDIDGTSTTPPAVTTVNIATTLNPTGVTTSNQQLNQHQSTDVSTVNPSTAIPVGPSGYAIITSLQLDPVTTGTDGVYQILIHLSNAYDTVCLALYINNVIHQVIDRDDGYCDVTIGWSGEVVYLTNYETTIKINERFSWQGGIFLAEAEFYDGSSIQVFSNSLTINVPARAQPYAVITRFFVDHSIEAAIFVGLDFDYDDTKICVLVTFDDVNANTLLVRDANQTLCYSAFPRSAIKHEVLTVPTGVVMTTVQHIFKTHGQHEIKAFYFNGTSVLEVSLNNGGVFDVEYSGCLPTFEIIRDDDNSHQTIYRSQSLTVSTYFSMDCDGVQYFASELDVKISWNIHDCKNGQLVQSFPRSHGVSMLFPKNTLEYGCHKIQVTLTVKTPDINPGKPTVVQTSTIVVVQPTPLVAKLPGGSVRYASKNKELLLDAEQQSTDPDIQPGLPLSLNFMFSYQLSSDGLTYVLGNSTETSNGPVSLQGNGTLIVNLPSTEVSDAIKVTVTVQGTMGRSSHFTQTVLLVDNPPPVIEIRCVRNCQLNIVNPYIASLWEIYFLEEDSYDDMFSYAWTVKEVIDNGTMVPFDPDYFDASYPEFEIYPDILWSEVKYVLKCMVVNVDTGAQVEVRQEFVTDEPPYGGSCYVTPSEGQALDTRFVFLCSGWAADWSFSQVETYQLTYSFYSNISGRMNLLTHSTSGRTSPTIVPRGVKENNYTLEVLVYICKRKTFCTITKVNMIVKPSSSGDRNATLLNLGLASSTQDIAGLGQLAGAMLIEDNYDDTADNEDWQYDDRVQIRTQFISALGDVLDGASSVHSAYDMSQMSNVLRDSTMMHQHLSEEATVSGSSVVKRLGQSMRDALSADADSLDASNVVDIASSLVSSMGSLLEASAANTSDQVTEFLQPQNEQYKPSGDDINDLSPREVLYQQEFLADVQQSVNEVQKGSRETVIINVFDGSDDVSQVMTDSRISVGNKVASVNSSSMAISVVKTEAGKPVTASSSVGNSISFDSRSGGQNISLESMKSNPFIFDASSLLINSGVVKMNFGNESAIEGENITVVLRNGQPTSDIPEVPLSIGKISVSRFELKYATSGILIYAAPLSALGSVLNIWIRLGTQPVVAAYSDDPEIQSDVSDFVFQLPKGDLGSISVENYKVFIPAKQTKGRGTYFMITEYFGFGQRRKRSASIAQNSSSNANVTISIFTPSCKVFNNITNTWSNGDCIVTEDSTNSTTTCVCPRRASSSIIGAQFFVAPNFIDFSSVFSKVDVIGNGAVLWTLVSFVALMFLIFAWTRRQDKKDIEKWATKLLVENEPSDQYFYKITVVTGVVRGAGTKSNVFIQIAGDESESEPRILKDTSNKNWLEQGTVCHFLMSSPNHLGNLQYVRIWHDNSGKGRNDANWFLNDVVIQDLMKSETFYFPCNKWLAVELDDGKIDRLLPVAAEDNLSSYKRAFSITARQKLTDEHIWISIFVNRPSSNFTRCQRLACAMFALFLSMITNAMFYREATDSTDSTSFILKIGPVVIDPKTLWISVVSALIVIPPSLMIIELFRRTKNKTTKNYVSTPDDNDDNKEKSNTFMLPHFFVYVGWTVIALGILASGFFTILYSFQWGKQKSEKWLSSMMLSFFQDSGLIQPLKVFAIALIIAMVCRKSKKFKKMWLDENDEVITIQPQSEDVGRVLNLAGEDVTTDLDKEFHTRERRHSQATTLIPDDDLTTTRLIRKLEKKSMQFFTEFLIYICYIALLFYIAYHVHQDQHFYRETSQLRNILHAKKFQQTIKTEELWDYFEKSLIPSIYPNTDYNGKRMKWRQRVFVEDQSNFRVGPVRLRQLRSKTDVCSSFSKYPRLYDNPINVSIRTCIDEYHLFDEDNLNYAVGWKNASVRITTDKHWNYRSSGETLAMPVWGQLGIYGGGGYVADFGVNRESALATIASLKQNLWINRRSRAVIVELTIYNVNSNIFATISLLAELPLSGGVVATALIHPFRLYKLQDSTNIFVADVIVSVIALYYIINTIKEMIKKKRKFFKNPWNFFGMARMVLIVSFVGMTLLSHNIQDETLENFQKNTYAYVNFQTLATLNENLRFLSGFILFSETIRVLEFFRYQKHMKKFSTMFKKGKRALFEFFFHFILSMAAYAGAALVLLSHSSFNFQTLAKTCQSLFGILLGDETYNEISAINRVAGRILFFVFSGHMTFLLMNFFIGLIDILFHSIRDDPQSMKTLKGEYFMVAIIQIVNLFRTFFNLEDIPYNVETEYEVVETEVVVVDNSAGKEPTTSTAVVKIKKKRLKRKSKNRVNPVKRRNWAQREELSSSYLEAIRKLHRLENAVDLLEIGNDKLDMEIPGYIYEDISEEVDAIYNGIRPELRYL